LTNSAQKSRKFWHLSPLASLVFSPDGLGFYILYLYHIFKKMVLVQPFGQFHGLSMGALIAGFYDKFCVEEGEIY
jgi:hypothetical protein